MALEAPPIAKPVTRGATMQYRCPLCYQEVSREIFLKESGLWCYNIVAERVSEENDETEASEPPPPIPAYMPPLGLEDDTGETDGS